MAMVFQEESNARSTYLLCDEALEVGDGAQLSKLSSVVNGLDGGARLMQRHVQETLRAVRSGTYRIDSIQLSRRIVHEALRMV